MYGWLWRHLPGPWPVRLVETLALVVGVVALLFYVVFPAADPHLPFNDVTVNTPTTISPAPTTGPTTATSPAPATSAAP
ncbi:MAG TPA: hypothetical protein VF288_08180 [Mycobacteriales bacterium]